MHQNNHESMPPPRPVGTPITRFNTRNQIRASTCHKAKLDDFRMVRKWLSEDLDPFLIPVLTNLVLGYLETTCDMDKPGSCWWWTVCHGCQLASFGFIEPESESDSDTHYPPPANRLMCFYS